MPNPITPTAASQSSKPSEAASPTIPAATIPNTEQPLLSLQDIRIGNRIQLSWATGTPEGVKTSSRLATVVPNPLLGSVPASYQRERNLDQSVLTFCVQPAADAEHTATTALPWMVTAECNDFTEKVTIRAVYQLKQL